MQVADMRVKLEAAKRIRLGMILIATTPSSVLHSYGSSQTDVGAAFLMSGLQMQSSVKDVPSPFLIRANILITSFAHAQCIFLVR